MEENVEQSATSRDVARKVSTAELSNDLGNSSDGEGVIEDPSTIPIPPPPSVAASSHKRSHLTGKFFWTAAFVVTALVSAGVGASLALLTPLASFLAPRQAQGQNDDLWRHGFQYRLARPVNILVMGIDRVPDVADNSREIFSGRSDTMLLLRLDPTSQQDEKQTDKTKKGLVKMLSIPRDTRVEYPGLTIAKINQANVDGGATMAARVVSNTLNNVPIDRYVRVSTGAFRELVDLVGGLEVYVPHPMHYVDETQHLKIDLEQGWQTLNGDQAEQFARFRNDQNGDIGRVQRQQGLLKSLRQRLQNPTVLARLPQIVQVMWKYVDTNLSLEETLALANFGLGLEQDDVRMVMLPGRFSEVNEYAASYWIMDPVAKDRVMGEFFQTSAVAKSVPENKAPNLVRIAIQNASGQPNQGHNVAEYLEEKGFKNVYVAADWPDLQRQTQIIVQQGDFNAANVLKKVLGLGKVEPDSTGDLESDLTIRVGKDWIGKQF